MAERLVFNYGTSGGDAPALRQGGGGTVSGGSRPGAGAPVDEGPVRERPDWAFRGLLIFTAVLLFRPQDMIPLLGPLHMAELAAIFALGAYLYGRVTRGQPLSRNVPEMAAVLALGAVILLTAPFSVWKGGAVATFTDLYAKVLLIFLLMVNTLTSARRVEQFTWLIVSAIGYIAFRAAFDYARGVNLIANNRVQGAVGGIFGNPNDLALNLVAIMPLGVSLALRARSMFGRLFAGSAVVFMVVATIATGSRGGALGLVLMAGMLGVKLLKRRPGLVFVGILAAFMSLPLLSDSYVRRVASIWTPSLDETGSREARRITFEEAFATFLENPLTGVGAGQYKNYNPEWRTETWRETHNAPLQVAAELGVLGLLCWGFLVVRAFLAPAQVRRLLRRAFREKREHGTPGLPTDAELEVFDAHQMAMAAAMVGWFVASMFASVAYHWTFYYLLALAIAPREILAQRLRAGVRARVANGRALVAKPLQA